MSHNKSLGLIIVVGEEENISDLSKKFEDFKKYHRMNLNEERHFKKLVDSVKNDTIILITKDGTCKGFTHRKFYPPDEIKKVIEQEPDSTPRKKIYKNRGGRHQGSIFISEVYPQTLVFVISQNGSITILSENKAGYYVRVR